MLSSNSAMRKDCTNPNRTLKLTNDFLSNGTLKMMSQLLEHGGFGIILAASARLVCHHSAA